MREVNIEFVSTQGKGFSPDLRLLKNFFMHKDELKSKFSFYIKPLCKNNDLNRSAVLSGRRVFCEGIKNVFCVDGSLPTIMRKDGITATKTMYVVPTDFHFKLKLRKKEIKLRKGFYKNFENIISGCPFIDNILKETYCLEKETVTNMPLPFNWALSHASEEEILAKRKDFESRFPQMNGKKVVYLVVSNTPDLYEFENFDLKDFLNKLPEDTFLLTNSNYLFEVSNELEYKYLDSFGFVKNMSMFDPLYFVDAVITNQANFATAFTSKNNNVFCIEQCNNFFEIYMKKMFKNIYIENINEFNVDDLFNNKFEEDFKKFNSMFTYNADNNPFEYAYNILK